MYKVHGVHCTSFMMYIVQGSWLIMYRFIRFLLLKRFMVYKAHGVHGSWCTLYKAHGVHGSWCTRFMVYKVHCVQGSLCTVHCTRFMVYCTLFKIHGVQGIGIENWDWIFEPMPKTYKNNWRLKTLKFFTGREIK